MFVMHLSRVAATFRATYSRWKKVADASVNTKVADVPVP